MGKSLLELLADKATIPPQPGNAVPLTNATRNTIIPNSIGEVVKKLVGEQGLQRKEANLDQFKNSLINEVALQQTLEDDGIEDFEIFNKLLFEEIEMCALDNFIESEDPTLNSEQFFDCLRISNFCLWIIMTSFTSLFCSLIVSFYYSSAYC